MRESWLTYRQSIGDRSPLFAAIREVWSPSTALYPGCYLDISPSTAIQSVTYVDTDSRAARYFGDGKLLESELAGRSLEGAGSEITFLHQDYRTPLPVRPVELLISLFAGPVWDNCREYLAPGGLLLANASHGDASLAALDSGLRLVAAVHQRDGRYRLVTDALSDYLIPRRPDSANAAAIRLQGRGVAYTKPAFAYLFRR